jgi:hypothetical protein
MIPAMLVTSTTAERAGPSQAHDVTKPSGTIGAPGRRRLFDRNRIGRRKGVLEGFVERLFLAPTLVAVAIVLMRFAFRIGNHFGFSNRA